MLQDPCTLDVGKSVFLVFMILLVKFCGMTAGIGPSFRTHGTTDAQNHGRTDRQTDMEVEIVI